MAKTLNEIAHEYAEQNPNVSIELAFLEGMLYKSSMQRESLQERIVKFRQAVNMYNGMYGREMVDAFFDYWSETNDNGNKMRFEKEKTWNLEKRLARWAKNNYGNRNNFSKQREVGDNQSLFDITNRLYEVH